MTDESQGPYFQLRVSQVIEETADAKSIVLDVPKEHAERFAYSAGQFLTFRIEVDGHRLVRCYSLASSPATDDAHKIAVKRVDDGRMSNWMNDHVVVGSELEIMPPAGHFCLRESDAPIILFGGGSGITPIISIIKTALAKTSRPIKLIYANRDEGSIIFKNELEALRSSNLDQFEIVHRLDDLHGFVDEARVIQEVGPNKDADFYICGPGPFMDVVEKGLGGIGVEENQIFIERFESSSEVSGVLDAPALEGGQSVTIKLDGTVTTIVVGEAETILAAARREGLEPPFACEEAYCGCCMAKVTSGEVEMQLNDGGIDQRQIDDGWVLTCQSIVKKSATIEYPD